MSKPLTVCASTTALTAWPVLDFHFYLGCVSIPGGRTSTTIPIAVHGDTRRESDEKLALLIAGLGDVRATDIAAIGTITNDD